MPCHLSFSWLATAKRFVSAHSHHKLHIHSVLAYRTCFSSRKGVLHTYTISFWSTYLLFLQDGLDQLNLEAELNCFFVLAWEAGDRDAAAPFSRSLSHYWWREIEPLTASIGPATT